MVTKKNKTLILSSLDIRKIVWHFGIDWIMVNLIERLQVAVRNFDAEKTIIPIREGFHYDQPNSGLIEWMPLYNQGGKVLIKVVGYHPSNPIKNNLPTIISTISEYDTNSGQLSAVIDGVLATSVRTGAASAVASSILAHPESSVLGLIGCGTQAVTQLHALSHCFNLEKILIFDTNGEALLNFEQRCNSLSLDVEFVQSNIDEIVRNSDILCTETTIEIGAGPLFSDVETKSHLHINAVGSDFPGKIEIPSDFLKRSFVCPDFIDQAIIEGECQQLDKDEIDADFVEIVQNSDKYRSIQQQRSVFDSTGWALEDKVVMDLFLDCAAELQLGKQIGIENTPKNTKNPYGFLEETLIPIEIESFNYIKEFGDGVS